MAAVSDYWYSDLGVLSIGAQCGGPNDGGLSDIEVGFFNCLLTECRSTYCESIDHLALALRISGRFQEFGPEAIERVRRSRKERPIGADIVVPIDAWAGRDLNALRDYLVRRVREALEMCIARLRRDEERIDSSSLMADFARAVTRFRAMDLERF